LYSGHYNPVYSRLEKYFGQSKLRGEGFLAEKFHFEVKDEYT